MFFIYFYCPDCKLLNPLNLSILLSGGKGNNCDILSSGERNEYSTPNNGFISVCFGYLLLYLYSVVTLESVTVFGDSPLHFVSAEGYNY